MNAGASTGVRQMQRSSSAHNYSRHHSSEQPFFDSQQVEYSRMLRSMQRGLSGEFLVSMEPSTPTSGAELLGKKMNGEFSPGLLDLNSFDTELLTDGRSIDDAHMSFSASRPLSKSRVASENNLLRSISADKEKTSSVAKIKVVVRKRPLNKKEIAKKEEDIVTIDSYSNALTVHETKLKVDLTEYLEKHEFVFDAVLDENVSNDEVYRETVEPMVPAIFQRTKATCFAYGQTGSGKTYTMQPLPLKASHDILKLIHHSYWNQGFQLFVSFFEIYGGKLFDLLSDRRKLCMREDGKQQVCIVGLQEFRVSNVETIRELIEKGNATRSTGTTGANEESSRSHAILQLAIKRSVDGSESKPSKIVGKLSFIDLAGSERGADTTDNDKQTRIEGAEINKSLLALKECIRALDNDQVHIPFRGSKLTEVLRDSFMGNSRTVMISCISPNSGSCEHTLNTLRYADRVKSLSKGNNKKDISSLNLNIRESTPSPLSPILRTLPGLDRNIDMSSDDQKFGWPKQVEKDTSLPYNVDRVPGGRGEGYASSAYNKNYRKSRASSTADMLDYSEEVFEQDKPSWRKIKTDAFKASAMDEKMRKLDVQTKRKEFFNSDINGSDSDEDLNALLKEEEDLVMAHQRQVEETIDIVKEELKLLDEADQPGNQLDKYISKLNAILSQKAAGIVNLQARLAHFQRRLTEQNVLVPSG